MGRDHVELFSADVIAETVRDLAAAIDRDLGRSRLIVITVLKGAVMFSCDLVRAMKTETEMMFLSASSYSGGFAPGETLRLQHDGELDVAGRHVLIVDDIIDTGRTLTELGALVRQYEPSSVSTVALINKTSRRAADADPTYSGLEITEELIYGYGLDWDECYRDLPYIALAST